MIGLILILFISFFKIQSWLSWIIEVEIQLCRNVKLNSYFFRQSYLKLSWITIFILEEHNLYIKYLIESDLDIWISSVKLNLTVQL